MNKQKVLNQAQQFIKAQFSGEGTGHDYFHIERVVKTARAIAKEENADCFITELAAWMHDVGDKKLHGDVDKSAALITQFLMSISVPQDIIDTITKIVDQVSFSKGNKAESIEAKIVQDADRLDAMGAIGIARAFAFGGSQHREIYNPDNPSQTTIKHFYDKLLLLKDLMNTPTAKRIAEKRHEFLEGYLKQFYAEWQGIK